MAPPISQEMRERIVYWRLTLGWSIDQCVEASGRSRARIFEILRLHKQHGVVYNPLARPAGRPRTLSMTDQGYLRSVLRARPTLFLDELTDILEQERGVVVSTSTVCRTLARTNITHKSVAEEASERNERLRAAWIAQWGRYLAPCFAWLDESGVDDQSNNRPKGWAESGHACIRSTSFNRGVKYSVLPVLTTDGIVAVEIFKGAVDKDIFIRFLRQQVVS